MFDKLIDLAILKWRSTFFIIFLLFIFGIVSYVKIPKELSPEIEIPNIQILVTYVGVSPEDGERMIIKPIERNIKTISGIKKLNCSAILGSVTCNIEFNAGLSISKALADVRDKVNIAKADFPEEAEEPIVAEFQLEKEQPVIGINIKGDVSTDLLYKIADDLKDQISSLKEVLEVMIYGKRDHSVEIIVKPEVINQYNININDLIEIRNQNKLLIGGRVRNGDGEFVLKIPGMIETLKDLLEMPIKSHNEKVVLFKDVAEVQKTYKEATSTSRINSQNSIALRVAKRSGENIIFTVQKVRAIVESYASFLPKDIEIIYTNDTSEEIKENLSSLNNNLMLAILIVFIVVLNLIGIREGIFVIITIPLTFLMSISFLYFSGYTMNIVVLFALILGTGMIVDASIVIIEYSEILLKDGVSHLEAYTRAAKKMFIPIFSSVFTTIIVSAPLLFWPDVIGEFMMYLPLTLIVLLASSFISAIFFLPVIATRLGKSHQNKDGEGEITYSKLISSPVDNLLKQDGAFGFYINTVWRFLNNPKKTMLWLVLSLITIVVLYANFNKGVEFFPNVESSFGTIRVKARGNLSLEEKDKIMKQIEERLVGLESDIKYYRTLALSASTDTIGRIDLEFTYWRFRRKAAVILEDIRGRTNDIPGVIINIDVPKDGPSAGKQIMLDVLSNESENLELAVAKLTEFMERDGNFKDIENTLPLNKLEYILKINRAEASKYGIDILTVGSFVSLATDGLIISDYRPSYSEDKVDIVLRFPKNYRSIEDIKYIKIPSRTGEFVPISSFATIETQKEVPKISRLNQKRVISVSANVKDGVILSDKLIQLANWIKENALLLNVNIAFAGDAEAQASTGEFLITAFFTALTIILLLFLMQFNSLGKTLIVMNSIFLSFFGVLIALMLTVQSFSVVMSGLAVVALAGMVVDSSILFVETFKDLEQEMEAKEALLKTAILRLKPILLVTITTVSGLLPMIFGISLDFFSADITIDSPTSAWWRQLSASIAGGLTFVTILTLFFTPTIILLEERIKGKIKNEKIFAKVIKGIFNRHNNSINT